MIDERHVFLSASKNDNVPILKKVDKTYPMEFCDICRNMLFVKTQDDALVKHCKHCLFSKELDSTKAVKITETLYSEDDLLYMQHLNKYIRFDPTLPRTSDIQCTNSGCSGPKNESRIIVYKYHPVHMKYFYCCDYCGHSWRTESKK